MSATTDLVAALKQELESVRMTHADLAKVISMAESTAKRMLAWGSMPLLRINTICCVLRLDFADLKCRVADRRAAADGDLRAEIVNMLQG